jgi:peptidoglycan/xylan/chitin deacetylase (PgdA/CDA1 family)
VTTGPLSTGTSLWFDRRNQLVSELGYCPKGLELAAMKQMPFDLLMERLDCACAQHGFTPDNEEDDCRPMSWEEARSLARRGFIIGAHGLNHAILTNETMVRAFEEIKASLAVVSSELGAPCTTFAFPNGNFTDELAQHAMRCGATTVMTTEPMWVDRKTSFYQLPRIQLFGSFSRERIELKIALAAHAGLLANPDGTGRTYWSATRRRDSCNRDRAKMERRRGNETLTSSAK